ncbi:hypothetical protein ONQ29_22125, partial [Salmonella enterica subsp. enterica serovar Montevideo]|nr:hypothetical protein [Salmonella enterica subsp. enterica serovar Montevideo]
SGSLPVTLREIWNVSRGKVLNYLISAHLKQVAGRASGCLPAHLTRNGSGPYMYRHNYDVKRGEVRSH